MKTTNEKIQEVKMFLTRNIMSDYSRKSVMDSGRLMLADEAETIVDLVKSANLGFASEIATSVLAYKRCSEKQAYWIAKVAVEGGYDSRVTFLYE